MVSVELVSLPCCPANPVGVAERVATPFVPERDVIVEYGLRGDMVTPPPSARRIKQDSG